MAKSELVKTMDAVQAALHPLIARNGFRKRTRTYNCLTDDGLTHVVGFQMGSFDPPGMTYIPGLRENYYGQFAVNLGVYVPEVANEHVRAAVKSWVHDYDCCIRTRLSPKPGSDNWWPVAEADDVIRDVARCLEAFAFPFLRRFESRDQILQEFRDTDDNTEIVQTPRILRAIIYWKRGELDEAKRLLVAQSREVSRNPRHGEYVVGLARRLGIEVRD